MKRLSRRIPVTGAIAATVLSTLAGCSGWSDMLAGDRINYQQASAAPTLQVPQDLTKPPTDPKYVAPPATVLNGNAPQLSITQDGARTLGLPTASDPLGMHVAEDRDQHWLVVDGRSPEELWPELKAFWAANGFIITTDSPSTGVMQTDWAENRAKIPQDWFRKTFGKLVDGIYSSGTRDRFRTRVEHAADGSTAIFITHQGMEEESVGRYQETTRWADRPRDPNLELAFMGRLMEKFGLTNAQAKQLIVQARPAVERVARVDESSGAPVIIVNEPLERAWLRVGLALDRSNFVVDERDRPQGMFVVRYADPVKDNDHQGFLGKLFGRKPGSAPRGQPYRVSVRTASNGGTQVAVVDGNGQVDDSKQARHLLSLLQAQLS
ncbi:outer membrane protein assembly factor BamC [Robbsia sp. Bb-Pol-6]|uniref:Outer membrane protein assembly factor BamC n=1 Tax=Robbsia betulipollinis TaxID=2981849 RepID=A0ABT3ZMU4_9BURK|nr:outer membrane protein assembly factor BamC [Robbsia betulipollinis]MCY0387884.1 outer membrane protein assembly factor BamC [Robbsia betulipollinis]